MALVLLSLLAIPAAAQDDKDCDDFATQAEAQEYFDANGGSPENNVDGLDRDHDGVPCEALDSGDVSPRGMETTINFELTVHGDVPEGVTFFGLFGVPASDNVGEIVLADPDGDGVYTGTVDSPTNANGETFYAIVYSRSDSGYAPGAVDILRDQVEGLEDGATVSASVSFGGDGQGQMPNGMGKTGGGGMAVATGGVPVGGLFAGASTIALAGWYTLRRRS
jgi:hypothetical protein